MNVWNGNLPWTTWPLWLLTSLLQAVSLSLSSQRGAARVGHLFPKYLFILPSYITLLYHVIPMCFWQLLSVHFQLLIWIFQPFTACWSATDSTLPILPPLAASVIFLFLCFIEYVPVAFCQNCSTDTWWTGENNYLLFLSVKYSYRQALVLCLLITDVSANYCWWYGESNDLFVWYSRAKPRQDEAMQGEKFPEDLSMGASVGVEVMEGGMGRSGQDGWKASHSRLSLAGIPPVLIPVLWFVSKEWA